MENGTKVFKASDSKTIADLGLVGGRAIVSTEKGVEHFDLQGDHIPVLVMVEAALDFAQGVRMHKVMHKGEAAGTIEFLMPICEATCKALDIQADWEGLAAIFKPEESILAKYVSGEYRGFSIGGMSGFELEGVA